VPVLRDGDTVIAESIAILEYLEETHPAVPLLPSRSNERAIVRQLMLWSGDYLAPAWKAWLAPRFDPSVADDAPTVAAGRMEIASHLDVLGERLGSSSWLAGAFSLADVCYAPFVTVLGMIGLDDLLGARPAVAAWIERLAARPSVRDSMPPPP
jgi:glutathione S-transferase